MICMSEPLKPPSIPKPANPGVGGGDSLVLERVTQRTKPPALYQVVLLNDDYTPMEFVVWVIQEYFNKDQDSATHIMLKIHIEGRGVCGVFSKDVADAKADQVMASARQSGHPLQCVTEPIES
jgi:ATP-dependent Clp protease adaptor protein ClpS